MLWTKEELARVLDGREYGRELDPDEIEAAKEDGLVIVFGASDDLCELRGAINDEIDCFEGRTIEHEKLPAPVKAIWCPEGRECSWAYETDLPHAEFRVQENDEVYCIGIVIDLRESESLEDKHWNECHQIALKAQQDHIDKLKGMIDALCGYVGGVNNG